MGDGWRRTGAATATTSTTRGRCSAPTATTSWRGHAPRAADARRHRPRRAAGPAPAPDPDTRTEPPPPPPSRARPPTPNRPPFRTRPSRCRPVDVADLIAAIDESSALAGRRGRPDLTRPAGGGPRAVRAAHGDRGRGRGVQARQEHAGQRAHPDRRLPGRRRHRHRRADPRGVRRAARVVTAPSRSPASRRDHARPVRVRRPRRAGVGAAGRPGAATSARSRSRCRTGCCGRGCACWTPPGWAAWSRCTAS